MNKVCEACLRHSHRDKPHKSFCSRAAKNGHLECLKSLVKAGYTCDEFTCAFAAEYGHLEVLKWLHENNCPWNFGTCLKAAGNGHLNCLQYAHQNGCPLCHILCLTAAEYGHIECLRYAHQQGASWDKSTYFYAYLNNQWECLLYAYRNKCPGRKEYHDKIKHLLLKENMTILRIGIRLKIYTINFRKRYYSPDCTNDGSSTGKGFLRSQTRFNLGKN